MVKILKKIRYAFIGLGTTLMMLPTKIFAVGRDVEVLYGPPEEYNYVTNNTVTNTVKNTANAVSETTSFEPDSMFFIRCLTFFLIPIIFLIGLIIFSKKSKSEKKAKATVIVFLSILIIAMLVFAITFVAGSFAGWF